MMFAISSCNLRKPKPTINFIKQDCGFYQLILDDSLTKLDKKTQNKINANNAKACKNCDNLKNTKECKKILNYF